MNWLSKSSKEITGHFLLARELQFMQQEYENNKLQVAFKSEISQITSFQKQVPKEKQTEMFSSTLNKGRNKKKKFSDITSK